MSAELRGKDINITKVNSNDRIGLLGRLCATSQIVGTSSWMLNEASIFCILKHVFTSSCKKLSDVCTAQRLLSNRHRPEKSGMVATF